MTWAERARYALLGLSAAAFGGSLVLLALVLLQAAGGSGAVASADAATTPGAAGSSAAPGSNRTSIHFSGPLPHALDGDSRFVAAGSLEPDLAFAAGPQPGATPAVTRYWVPVAALGTGVDALTSTQLRAMLAPGGAATWESVGGFGGRPRMLIPNVPPDLRGLAAMLGFEPVPNVAGYDELFAELANPAGDGIAFVPLDRLKLGGVAITIDGLDLVRGSGDAGAWPFAERASVVARTRTGSEVLAAVAERMTAPLPVVLRVVATGDILQSRCSLARIMATGDWAAALRGPVGDYLAAADLALGSLDGSIQDVNPPFLCVAGTNLSSPPEVMAALTYAGFDGMTVATNHVFDCGRDYCGSRAFLQTLDRLHAAGIRTVGGGHNLAEALAPAIFEIHGIRIGVLGFDDVAAMDLGAEAASPGTAPLDDDYSQERAAGEPAFYRPAADLEIERFTAAIRGLRPQVDVVIVQVQTGTEDTHTPTARSIKALRAAAAAGADVVVGNQAHWVQAAEVRDGAFIAYALGNFIFDQVHTPEHTQGYLLEATFHGKMLVTVRLVPYQIENQYRPVFLAGAQRLKVIRDVLTASQDLPAK
ncbi:MAG: CapA family protein [Dehalococcoidia bacterium]|nr:CapA family protein [Dehalococcoidia bacterium]